MSQGQAAQVVFAFIECDATTLYTHSLLFFLVSLMTPTNKRFYNSY